MKKQTKSEKIQTITLNRMGIGGYIYQCPVKNTLNIIDKIPKSTELKCKSCGQNHTIEKGRTKHFSNYL
jgi:transcription elongation factor Elf1